MLVDSSKFSRKAGLILCGLDRVSCVITDTGASDKAVQLLEQYGITVVTVEPDDIAPDLCAPYFNPQFDLQSAAMFQTETSH